MELSCREAELAVSLQLDGVLSPDECRELLLHLSSCRDCGAFARGQQTLRAALRVLAAAPLPCGLSTFSAHRKFSAVEASSS